MADTLPLLPKILCARMRCFHPNCMTSKLGDQGGLKARRETFRKANRNPTSSRLTALLDYLVPSRDANAGKVLIFSEFLQTLDITANALDDRDIAYLRFRRGEAAVEKLVVEVVVVLVSCWCWCSKQTSLLGFFTKPKPSSSSEGRK
jgi:SNF2 family DNA or RNA helicase